MERHISRRHGLRLIAAILGGTLGLMLSARRLAAWLQLWLDVPPPIQLIIIPRPAWDARAPNHEAPDEYGFAASPTDPAWYVYPGSLAEVYTTVVIHHSAMTQDASETMRNIQDLHLDVNQWADIGYHYGIDQDGHVYEGRDIGSRGASVTGHNTGTIGVVVMGNFQVDQPQPAQLATLQTLVNWLTEAYTLTHLAGHSEFDTHTVCPGQHLAVYLDALAQNAGLQRGTGGYVAPT
ncbi:MAG TPA: peptidoglycan recognition family protein [Phototrophicaceae bacterium]|nr:peptidoglycan recognition family protein [Phototrophicaceae bacterium]